LLTDNDLQKAFRLISGLHPDRAVALCVLLDACDRISLIRKNQLRRPDATHPTKLIIPEESLLQVGIYTASEIWEKDQESEQPRKEPKYNPTNDDKLARYVKTLAWKSMDRHSRYAAVGLGCLLYTYQPHEVSSISEELFNSDNIRRNKNWMFEQIKKRFQGTKGFTNGNEHIALEVPSSHQRALIQMSLSSFAPWCSCSDATIQTPPASLLETYFDKESEKSEWERVHVLFDPTCGGFPRLVHEYNSNYRRGSDMRLDDPDKKLGSPKFGDNFGGPSGDGGDGGPSDPEDRFNPSPLTRHELSSIKYSFERNQQRRKNYHAGRLRVYADGEEMVSFAHEHFDEPFVVPNTASCIEVFGEDAEGELLLAVFPLTYLETSDGVLDQKLSITHDRGQTIELTLSPVAGQTRESLETLVRPEYLEPPQRLGLGIFEDMVLNACLRVTEGDAKTFVDDDLPSSGECDVDKQPDDSKETIEVDFAPAREHIGVLTSGAVVGTHYQILNKLGEGGMGVVYLAQDRRTRHEPVTIKVLNATAGLGKSATWLRAKFRSEIERLARIEHPGVARMLDYGDLSDGRPYLVMEYVRGVNLREALGLKRMELTRVVNLSYQIAQALAAAHKQGILHRDLKPQNIMLHRDGRREHVKLLDFGIAKVLGTHTAKEIITGDIYARADSDTVIGNKYGEKYGDMFGYMSPEQLMGKRAQTASDVYALGAVLYEMLMGHRPFNPETPDHLLQLQRAGLKVSLCDLRPDLPQTAETVILKALAFEPHARYRSAEDFGADLAHAFGGKTEGASTDERQLAHVLFIDLVSCSRLIVTEQRRQLEKLGYIVCMTKEFKRAHSSNQVVWIPTGSGMALVFLGDHPLAAVKCAVEMASVIKNEPDLRLRMGMHTGAVLVIADRNDRPTVMGDCLNVAQRVMNYGDAGHILLSETVADELSHLIEWSRYLRDYGERIDKHGYRMHIFNLYTGEVGNP